MLAETLWCTLYKSSKVIIKKWACTMRIFWDDTRKQSW